MCIEALSVTINERGLEQATRSLGRLSSEVTRVKATDSRRLQAEYQNLVNGLIDQGLLDQPANNAGLASVCVMTFAYNTVSQLMGPHTSRSFVSVPSFRTF